MNRKLLLPICLLTLSLSACSFGSKSLYGESNLELDSNQINEVLLSYLDSRSHVSGAEISINHDVNDVEGTALAFNDKESSNTSITYNRYSNTALSYTYDEESLITSGASGISYNSNVSMKGYSWLALDLDDEEGESYNHYSHIQTSYNNGYESTSSATLGTTDSEHRLSYWSSYIVDTFYLDLLSTYINFTYSSSMGEGESLYDEFVSNNLLFDNSSNLTFIYSGKDNDIIAYHSESEISQRSNPLYATDESRDIAAMSIKSISYTLTNDTNYGYVLSAINVSYTYELLENIDNVYLSNPRVVETYNFDLTYSYSDSLSLTSLPTIESVDASFYPILSTYEEIPYEEHEDDDGGLPDDDTEVQTYEDDENEIETTPLVHYQRIRGTRYTDIVNMTSYYQSEDSSFKGSAYELEMRVNNTSNAFSFSSSLAVDENNESIYNLWGYSDISGSSYSSSLLEDVTSSDTSNLFKISRTGTYSFILLFSEEYELVSISMYVLSMD